MILIPLRWTRPEVVLQTHNQICFDWSAVQIYRRVWKPPICRAADTEREGHAFTGGFRYWVVWMFCHKVCLWHRCPLDFAHRSYSTSAGTGMLRVGSLSQHEVNMRLIVKYLYEERWRNLRFTCTRHACRSRWCHHHTDGTWPHPVLHIAEVSLERGGKFRFQWSVWGVIPWDEVSRPPSSSKPVDQKVAATNVSRCEGH